MNRQNHRFQYRGDAIAAAAKKEADYHRGRLSFWQEAQNAAIETAKAKGIEVREHDITGGKRAEMVLDPVLQKRMDECATKIDTHRRKCERYDIEAAAYGARAEMAYDLDADDVVYFRLAGGAREE